MNIYDKVEKSYLNWALDFVIWNYRSLSEEIRPFLHERLKNSYLQELGLKDKDENIFFEYNKFNFNLMKKILSE